MKLADAIVLAFAKPLTRIAVSLEHLHEDALRYFDAANIPERPDPEQVKQHEAERAVVEPRPEWEIAVDEEIQRRRQEVDRS